MHFQITRSWNGTNVDHPPVQLTFEAVNEGLEMRVTAPFFNDPGNPGGEPGQPFQNLWEYEGLEIFCFASRVILKMKLNQTYFLQAVQS